MTDSKQDPPHNQTREDLTELYSSARLPGATYRDYSASRSDAREQFQQLVTQGQTASGQAEPAQTVQPEAETAADEIRVPEQQAAAAITAPNNAQEPGEEKRGFGVQPHWLDREPLREAAPEADTLLRVKKRVASRWFALRNLFPLGDEPVETPAGTRSPERQIPALLIFSVVGGVGKTSLAAMLGRALAAHSERILLADTASFGLLPFYFGSRQLKPGVVRTFAPPEGSGDAPVHVVTLDPGEHLPEEADPLLKTLRSEGRGLSRILIDVQTAAKAVASRLLPFSPTVLVPLLPDMSSVASLSSVEAVFTSARDSDGQTIEPVYLLNRFNAALPLHVDVREILQEQLGSRLLPFVVRYSPAVSEALAEGMTVMDYAPTSPVVEDYIRLAAWLRSISAASPISLRGVRWSER